jgi:SAM-dependent methyltransferase
MRWFRSRDRQQRSTGRTDSTSTGASGRRFFFLGGRRYLADAEYVLPKDEGEINRLDFQHYMLRQALRANFLAPVRSPAGILDVGCGTGRWPVEMARAFRDAHVVGLDLELPAVVAASDELRPRNCTFVIGDVLQGLPFPDASFGFVHQRLLMGAIPAPRWPAVVHELARVARPGGWIELVEAAPASGGGHALAALNGWMLQATARRGVDVYICQQLSALLQAAGLAGVTERRFDLPMGRHGGHMGTMAETQYLSLFGSLRGMIVGQGMVDAATYDGAMRNAREEMARTACVSPYVVAYAQRLR